MTHYGDDWRDTEFGEGQERHYGNLPPASPPPESPAPIEPSGGGGGGRGKAPYVIGAAVLAVAVAAGGIYLAMSGDESSPDTQGSGQASTPASQPSPTAEAETAPESSQPTSRFQPTVSGWQVADGNGQHPVIFDVPPASKTFTAADGATRPEWQLIRESGQQYGYAHPKTNFPLAMTSYAATYRTGHCRTSEGSALAFVGFDKSSSDAPEAAGEASDKFLKAMSLKEDGSTRIKYTAGKPKSVKVNGGKTAAVQIRTDLPWSRSDDKFCVQKERQPVVTSVPTKHGTGTVVAVRLKDAPGGLDEKTFDKVLGTIRPRP